MNNQPLHVSQSERPDDPRLGELGPGPGLELPHDVVVVLLLHAQLLGEVEHAGVGRCEDKIVKTWASYVFTVSDETDLCLSKACLCNEKL